MTNMRYAYKWEYDIFLYPLSILFSTINHMLGLSGTSTYIAFVYFAFVFSVFACLTHGTIIFVIVEPRAFRKSMDCMV